MTSTKQAEGTGNTQVGKNLTNEVIRIDHCTININLKNEKDFVNLKKFIDSINLKKTT